MVEVWLWRISNSRRRRPGTARRNSNLWGRQQDGTRELGEISEGFGWHRAGLDRRSQETIARATRKGCDCPLRERTENREIKHENKILLPVLTLTCLLAISATAQVNYAVSGNSAYVTISAGASGNIVLASTYKG